MFSNLSSGSQKKSTYQEVYDQEEANVIHARRCSHEYFE